MENSDFEINTVMQRIFQNDDDFIENVHDQSPHENETDFEGVAVEKIGFGELHGLGHKKTYTSNGVKMELHKIRVKNVKK